jgi:hypothetical protein
VDVNRGIQRFGVLFGVVTFLAAAMSVEPATVRAAPGNTMAEQDFFSEVFLYARPPVTNQRLLQLGYQACAVRRGGGSSDEAKSVLWRSLYDQGVLSAQAEVGSLVHVAVDTLCPEVGYP